MRQLPEEVESTINEAPIHQVQYADRLSNCLDKWLALTKDSIILS